MCSLRDSFKVSLYESIVSRLDTNMESVSGRTDSKLVDFGVLSCWLQVICKCTRLECVKVPFVKGTQRHQITERECMIPLNLNYVEFDSNQLIELSSLCMSDSVLSLL